MDNLLREALVFTLMNALHSDDQMERPIFEWGHEVTPTHEEMLELCQELAEKVMTVMDVNNEQMFS